MANADAAQRRFDELVALAERGHVEPVTPITRASLRSGETQLLATSTLSQRRTHVEVSVLRAVGELTGAPSAALTTETPLREAGVDSLAATELASRLRALTGAALSPTLVSQQPTPRAIVAHVLNQLVCEARAAGCGRVAASSLPSRLLRIEGSEGFGFRVQVFELMV